MRKENWPRLLSDYLVSHKHSPFVWGENDCVLFAAKGYYHLTGEDFFSMYLGYSDKEGAEEIIKENRNLATLVSKHIGTGHNNILQAGRGDIALLRLAIGDTLGMVDDTGQRIACLGKEGLLKLPLSKAYIVWSY